MYRSGAIFMKIDYFSKNIKQNIVKHRREKNKNAQNLEKKSSAQGRNQKNFKKKNHIKYVKHIVKYLTNTKKNMRSTEKYKHVQTNKQFVHTHTHTHTHKHTVGGY